MQDEDECRPEVLNVSIILPALQKQNKLRHKTGACQRDIYPPPPDSTVNKNCR